MTAKNDKTENESKLETQLNVLRELETNPAVSQRQLASHLACQPWQCQLLPSSAG